MVIFFEPNPLRIHGIPRNNNRELWFPTGLFTTIVACFFVVGQIRWQNKWFGEASFAIIFISSTCFLKKRLTTNLFCLSGIAKVINVTEVQEVQVLKTVDFSPQDSPRHFYRIICFAKPWGVKRLPQLFSIRDFGKRKKYLYEYREIVKEK